MYFLISICSKLDYILWAGVGDWVDSKTNKTSNAAHIYLSLKLLIQKIPDCNSLASSVENGMEDLKLDKRLLQKTG